jgi:pyrroloquinoline-quinone synthase
VGAAVVTIFVEGSMHERREFEGTRRAEPVDDLIARHPMVCFYGCPPDAMRLTRAHQAVEGDHRRDAWETVLRHVPDGAAADAVVDAVAEAHRGWLAYRDGVARAMGLPRGKVGV